MKISEVLVHLLARLLVAVVDLLPLGFVVACGRMAGLLGHLLLKRIREMAKRNLALCFPEWTPAQVKSVARENFARIGENIAASIKLHGMRWEKIQTHCQFTGVTDLLHDGENPPSVLIALGHFGCFDLFAWVARALPYHKGLTTYRGLNPPALDRLFQARRARSGTRWFERRFEAMQFKEAMAQEGVLVGLLADQRGGSKGLNLPFLGRECSVEPAPALFAIRYRMKLHVAVCQRVAPAQWRLEMNPEIPTRVNGKPRRVEDVMRDVNAQLEKAVRDDPADWFWVHDRWKNPPTQRKTARERANVSETNSE